MSQVRTRCSLACKRKRKRDEEEKTAPGLPGALGARRGLTAAPARGFCVESGVRRFIPALVRCETAWRLCPDLGGVGVLAPTPE